MFRIRKTVYVQERVSFFRELWRSAAQSEGFAFEELSRDFWQVRDDSETVARFHNYIVSIDDPVTLDMAGDKLLMHRILSEAGLPIARHAAAGRESLHVLEEFAAEVPGPYVVKPARNTSSGLGVTTGIRSRFERLTAAALALGYCDEILIEEHVAGESYRLLFLGHEMICASRRTGHRVVGDGASTVLDLIAAQADAKRRATGRFDWRHDSDVRTTLSKQSLNLGSVPDRGAEILVRSVRVDTSGAREVRTVYTEDVTDLLCEAIVESAKLATRVLGSQFCGVDVITDDPTVPLEASRGVITEINTTPGLHHHYGLGSAATERPLAATVLRYLAETGGGRSVHRGTGASS